MSADFKVEGQEEPQNKWRMCTRARNHITSPQTRPGMRQTMLSLAEEFPGKRLLIPLFPMTQPASNYKGANRPFCDRMVFI